MQGSHWKALVTLSGTQDFIGPVPFSRDLAQNWTLAERSCSKTQALAVASKGWSETLVECFLPRLGLGGGRLEPPPDQNRTR